MGEDSIQPGNEAKEPYGDAKKTDSKAPIVPVNVGKIDPKEDPRASDANKKNRKHKPLSRFEIWTIVLASLGILIAAGTGAAIYWQARIGAETLTEIKNGGSDTHDLAEAGKTQSQTLGLAAREYFKGSTLTIENLAFYHEGRQRLVDIRLKDIGKPPAKNVQVDSTLSIGELASPIPSKCHDIWLDRNDPTEWACDIAATIEVPNGWMANSSSIVSVGGYIQWTDRFGLPFKTYFCRSYPSNEAFNTKEGTNASKGEGITVPDAKLTHCENTH